MRNVIVRHRQNGQLGNRTISSHHTSCPLIDGGQIGVHITRVSTASGDFLPRRRHLTQRIGVRTHIRQDDQNMQIPLIRQILGRGQRQTGSNDTLNGRIVRQVEEQRRTLHGPALLEITAEETRSLHIYSHGSEDDGEILLVRIRRILKFDERGLTGDLGSHLVVGKTGGTEDGDLLPTRHGVHDIDGGNTRLDHGLGIIARGGVNGLSVDVQVGLGEDLGTGVDDLS
mmetsp:Transcript_17879/g.43010  ORF Transcript_17879/g.43010 Transcript_17879/m.43010 type:complete len:228 (-) Transcript_17879:463-1146(-)